MGGPQRDDPVFEGGPGSAAIEHVAQDGITPHGELDPELVGASGERMEVPLECIRLGTELHRSDHAAQGDRMLAVGGFKGPLFAADQAVFKALKLSGVTVAGGDGFVRLTDQASFKGRRQDALSALGMRKEHESRDPKVQPMHRVDRPAGGGLELPPQRRSAGSVWNGEEEWGFVNDNPLFVLKNNVHRPGRILCYERLMLKLYLTCHRGFEKEAARELAGLGVGPVRISGGGLEAQAELHQVGVIQNGSRLINHLYQRLDSYRVRSMSDHFMRCLHYPWEQIFDVKKTFSVGAQFVGTEQVSPDFRNSHFLALRTKDAICDRFRQVTGARPNVNIENPDVRIHVVLVGHSIFVYRDLVGKSLHQRGYRKMPGPAPLKETLAASLIAAVKWNPSKEPLVDLMCGSGTIAIEASMWARTKGAGSAAKIFAYDADPEAVARASANITAAQAFPAEKACGPIELGTGRADEIVPPAGVPKGVIVLNAPYGERLHSAPSTVYSILAQTLAAKWPGWRAAILGPAGASQYFEGVKGIRIAEARKIRNGPLLCEMIVLVS